MLWSIQNISAHPEMSLTYFSKRRPFKKVLYVADYKCFQVPINMKLKFEFCTEFFMAGITSCSFSTLLHKQSALFWWLLTLIDDYKSIDWLIHDCKFVDWLMTQNQCLRFSDDYFQILVQWLITAKPGSSHGWIGLKKCKLSE